MQLVKGLLGDGEFLANSPFMKRLARTVCNGDRFGREMCDSVIFALDGPETDQLNRSRTAVYVAHAPAGTSTENMLHWMQMAHTGRMQKYDFRNAAENERHYGQVGGRFP